MATIIKISLFLLVNISFIIFFKKISHTFNLYDYPNLERKKHVKPVSLLGGFIFFINFDLFIFFDIYTNNKYFLEFLGFNSNIKITLFLTTFNLIYLIGYIDDKINLKPFNKLFLFTILIYFLIHHIPNLNIKTLRTSVIDYDIDLFFLGPIFSVICIITYINAMNMFDGINLTAFLHFSSIAFLFILNNFMSDFSLILIFSLLVYGYLNFRNLTFLGDSGVFILSFITSVLLIVFYNYFNLNVEDILLAIYLPIIDFFRLFFTRIYNGKNPLYGDEKHLHHYLKKKFNYNILLVIYFSLIYFPILINYLLDITKFLLILMITIYFLLLKFVKPKPSNI